MTVMESDLGLGRMWASDERDNGYLLKEIVEQPSRTEKYHNDNGWWGDQGRYPFCVGYAWAHWLEDGPVTQPGPGPILDPVRIYMEAQRVDEWSGEGYDGTSVRAGAKVLQSFGFISEYRWAFDANEVFTALLEGRGGVVLGTNWYSGMNRPDKEGFVRVTGSLLGGHAYCLTGGNLETMPPWEAEEVETDLRRGVARLKNSWGREWGHDGRFRLSFDDLDRLLGEDGEACQATEIKQKK